MSRPGRTLLRNLLTTLLLLAVLGGLGWLAQRYTWQRDITFNAANSLEPASVAVLKSLTGPVKVTVYATEHDPRLGDVRKLIRDFFALYQRYKSDIELVFINPEQFPDQARQAQIKLNGEMVLEYAGRREHLTKLNEPVLTNALLRLGRSEQRLVFYLDGHGERKLDGIANFDLGNPFGAKLKQNGLQIKGLNLAIAPEVPRNTAVLVLTQPQLDLLPGEVDKLLQFVEQGGNVLWLIDQGPLHGLERLAEALDLILPPGTVIDPAAAEMRAPLNWALGSQYGAHAITRNFDLITAFPSARPLVWNDNLDWKRTPLLEVAARGWVSLADGPATIQFQPRRDTLGPVTLATALERERNERQQRIVVVGNGEFLSNSFAGNGGNVDLGLNMLNWLSSDERLINISARPGKDSQLQLSQTWLTVISAGLLLLVPLLLAAWGGYLWWSRRRA